MGSPLSNLFAESYDPAVDKEPVDPYDKPLTPDDYRRAQEAYLRNRTEGFKTGPYRDNARVADEPNMFGSLADLLGRAATAITGKDPSEARRDASSLLGNLPFTGTGMSAEEGKSDLRQGDYPGAVVNLGSTLADIFPLGHAAAAVAKPAILHAIPNLFRKPAIEDAARGVDPADIWKQWGWEKYRPAGWSGIQYRGDQWITETPDVGIKFRDDVAARPGYDTLPARRTELTKAEVNPDQPLLPFAEGHLDPTPPMHRAPKTNELWEVRPAIQSERSTYPKGTVQEFVEHPALFNEPGLEEIASVPMTMRHSNISGDPNVGGMFWPPTDARPTGHIAVKHTSRDPLGVTIHEIGHKAQSMADMPGGYNPKTPGATGLGVDQRNKVYAAKAAHENAINKRTADYWRAEDEWLAANPEPLPGQPGLSETPERLKLKNFNKQWALDNPDLQADIDRKYLIPKDMEDISSWDPAQLAYWTEGGEVSARNMSKRAKMSLLDLANVRPEATEEVPRFLQWDNYYPRPQPRQPFKDPETPWKNEGK